MSTNQIVEVLQVYTEGDSLQAVHHLQGILRGTSSVDCTSLVAERRV